MDLISHLLVANSIIKFPRIEATGDQKDAVYCIVKKKRSQLRSHLFSYDC